MDFSTAHFFALVAHRRPSSSKISEMRLAEKKNRFELTMYCCVRPKWMNVCVREFCNFYLLNICKRDADADQKAKKKTEEKKKNRPSDSHTLKWTEQSTSEHQTSTAV